MNQVKAAIDAYDKVLREATEQYESALRIAERELKESIGAQSQSPVPSDDYVTMKREDYQKLQDQLEKVAKFIQENPDMAL